MTETLKNETEASGGPSELSAELGGRWEHCSPELLQAGIDCGATPRRPCECVHGDSHDHFISGDRLEIETFDTNGKRVQWGLGPTQAELEEAHLAGTCHAFCAYCITEAESLMTPNTLLTGSSESGLTGG